MPLLFYAVLKLSIKQKTVAFSGKSLYNIPALRLRNRKLQGRTLVRQLCKLKLYFSYAEDD